MFYLPREIINKIFEYDSTYHEKYKLVLHEISMFPIWNIKHKKTDTQNIDYYYHLNIAQDMLIHWENYHYTYFLGTISENENEFDETRELVNYLDVNSIRSKMPCRDQTIFEWIRYFNKITSVK